MTLLFHRPVTLSAALGLNSDTGPGLGAITWYPPHCQDPGDLAKPGSWLEYSKGDIGNAIEGDVSKSNNNEREKTALFSLY